LLNVALMMAVLEQTPVLPLAGVTRTTVGALVEDEAGAFLSGSPHPEAKPISRTAVIKILWLLLVRIRTSCSRPI
jgi:hypothetical protein